MKYPHAIKHISFLRDNGVREKGSPNEYSGLFSCGQYAKGTPYEFIDQAKVKKGDPTITLHNGNKIRVFQGGDPSHMIEYARAAIERHMSLYGIEGMDRYEPDTDPPFSDWFDWTKY